MRIKLNEVRKKHNSNSYINKCVSVDINVLVVCLLHLLSNESMFIERSFSLLVQYKEKSKVPNNSFFLQLIKIIKSI